MPMFDMKWLAAVIGVLLVLWLCFCGLVKIGQMIGTHGPEPSGMLGMTVALIVLLVAANCLKGDASG